MKSEKSNPDLQKSINRFLRYFVLVSICGYGPLIVFSCFFLFLLMMAPLMFQTEGAKVFAIFASINIVVIAASIWMIIYAHRLKRFTYTYDQFKIRNFIACGISVFSTLLIATIPMLIFANLFKGDWAEDYKRLAKAKKDKDAELAAQNQKILQAIEDYQSQQTNRNT